MQKLTMSLALLASLAGCQSPKKQNEAMIEKYPACYHKIVKLANKCIELNESGKPTTALQLENAAYPGQYQ